MNLKEYLRIQKTWERELTPLVTRMLDDPEFPPITKSFELTRYVRGKISQSDLRRYSRKEILWATRFIWHVYKYALEDGIDETREEMPALWA